MNVFFDTSSLFKLYHFESGTDELMSLFDLYNINAIHLAEITSVEFASVVWKKCRKGEVNEKNSQGLIEKFKTDCAKYIFVPEERSIRNIAEELVGKHWKLGLRTLDSIQLASALRVKDDLNLFITADTLLSKIASLEGLLVK